VAAPVKQRPGRALAFVALILVGLYLGVFLGPSATPSLGLDLQGGTEVTLTAEPLAGGTVTKGDLNQAVNIIRNRVNGLGVGGAQTHTQGSRDIVVSIPGATNRKQVVDTVGETALLRFRQVLQAAAATPAPTTVVTTTPSPTPGAKKGNKGATPTTSPSATHTKKSKSSSPQGDAMRGVLLDKKPATKKSSPSPTATPTQATPTPATPTESPTPTSSLSTSPPPEPSGLSTKPMPGSESATLTPAFMQSFNNWDCLKNGNPTHGNDVGTDYIIACDATQPEKYLLAPAEVQGNQVSSANAGLDQNGINWVVNVNFTGSGNHDWFNLTKKTFEVTGDGSSGIPGCTPPKGCNAIAITLDGVVQSAPATSTDGISGGGTQISGSFSQDSATQLANVLKYGSLPLKFTVPTSQSVSATLGKTQLHGGLIAGAIGLALVILFSLLYYRALGFVTVGSLAVSGLILYAVTTLLGHSSLGYTLSLAGIAGFIVAIGITADSFVVFFERLRDEIRDGRRLRSGVDRAWPRARRTILSADTVSLLAAVILYVVSIGDVRGFAFTLGLSTLSDLFIVFFFTKPLLQILAKVKAFDSGKGWTGVGKVRAGVVRDELPQPGVRRPRTKEA
jgi:preprotein translocase subunit SecD